MELGSGEVLAVGVNLGNLISGKQAKELSIWAEN